MSKSTKATLLSALVFPGVGQLSIGHKRRGWVIIIISSVFLYLIMSKVMQQAYNLVEKIQASGAMLDMESISKQTSDLVGFSDNTYLNTLLVFFLIAWGLSIIDAYFLGKKV